jgi:hypothetical protein
VYVLLLCLAIVGIVDLVVIGVLCGDGAPKTAGTGVVLALCVYIWGYLTFALVISSVKRAEWVVYASSGVYSCWRKRLFTLQLGFGYPKRSGHITSFRVQAC